KARRELGGMPCRIVILGAARQDRAKAAYVRRLAPRNCVCIGNGRNDRLMLRSAALAIVAIQPEGAAAESLRDADIVVNDIRHALDLLLHHLRPGATLR